MSRQESLICLAMTDADSLLPSRRPHPDPAVAAAATAAAAVSTEGAVANPTDGTSTSGPAVATATTGPAVLDGATAAEVGAAAGAAPPVVVDNPTSAPAPAAPPTTARKSPQPEWDITRWLFHFRSDLVPGPIVLGHSLGRNDSGLLAVRSGDCEKAFLIKPDLLRGHISADFFASTFSGNRAGPQKRLNGGSALVVYLPGVKGTVLMCFLQYFTPGIALKPTIQDFRTLEESARSPFLVE